MERRLVFGACRVAAFDEGGGEMFQDIAISVCGRIGADNTLSGVESAVFEPEPAAPCSLADVNADGVISAADLVAAARLRA